MARPRTYIDTLLKTRLHNIHTRMMNQCYLQSYKGYLEVGGQGIGVCLEWFDFAKFYEWAKNEGYTRGLSLVRIDPMEDFTPDNCIFVNKAYAKRLKKTQRILEYKGTRLPLKVWARQFGLQYNIVMNRLMRGWSVERTLETPPRKYADKVRDNEDLMWE